MNSDNKARDRVYQVSSNRQRASHKLRYVEASAPADGDCRLCVGSVADKSATDDAMKKATATSDGESSQREDQ